MNIDYIADYHDYKPSLVRESPVLDALMEAILEVIDSQQVDLLWVSENLLSIDNASGYHLDFIGSLVGQTRFLTDFNIQPYFGFDGSYQSRTFGSLGDPEVGGYWNSRSHFNTATSKFLSDEDYKRLIKARVISNNSSGSTNDLLEVINLIVDSVDSTVQTLRQGLIQINTDDPKGMLSYFVDRLAIEDNILPIAAGVRVVIESTVV